MSSTSGLPPESYAQVLENLPQTAVVVFDNDLCFRLVAGPALADAGIDRERVEGRRLVDIVPPEVFAQLSPQYQRALAGEVVSTRYRSTLNDRVFWLRILPLAGPGESPAMAMAVTLDITELADAEQQIRDTVSALDAAQQIARVGSWSWDPASGRVEWSAETYRIFGMDASLGPPTAAALLQAIDGDDRRRLLEAFTELRHGSLAAVRDGDFRLQTRIRRGGYGETRWLLVTCHQAHSPRRLVGTVQDVTELREAELEATRQRDQVQAIITAAEEGILLADAGRIVDVNPSMCRLIGYDREELIGMAEPYPFWSERSSDALSAHAATAAQSGQTAEIEAMLCRRDGVEIPVAITTVVAADTPGARGSQVSTVRDITRQKRQEAELRALAARDPLTGLHNQRGFREHMESEIGYARREGRPVSLLLLDIDHFKAINDRHGHPVGDTVLAEVARRLRQLARPEDCVARIGGEEFGWILPDHTEDGAFALAERARRAISGEPFAAVGRVTASFGVCELDGHGGAEELYIQADVALYGAKQTGRDRSRRSSHVRD